jgi:beta-glucosidase
VEGPLFPFGFGLSYTKFNYTNLVITPTEQGPGGKVEVACDVSNIGGREGDDVVQLYLRDDYSSVITYEKVLRGFERVHLKAGETTTVRFTLTPEHLQLFDRNNHWVVEPGRFTVMIGESSDDTRLQGHFDISDGQSTKEKSSGKTATDDPL